MILEIFGSSIKGVLEADPVSCDCKDKCIRNHDYRDGYNDGVKDALNPV